MAATSTPAPFCDRPCHVPLVLNKEGLVINHEPQSIKEGLASSRDFLPGKIRMRKE